MYQVYSIHGFDLGIFLSLSDAISQSDGWEIVLVSTGKVRYRRMSLEYRDNRWEAV